MKGNIVLPFLVFWPMLGALCCYLVGRENKKWRDYCANFFTIMEFVIAVSLFSTVQAQESIQFTLLPFGHDRLFFQMDGFRFIYAVITSLMWMGTTIFSREYFAHYRNRNRYYLFMLITLGATMGVFLSGDLLTTFTFFEVMSFTSYVMVIHDEKPGALRAAQTYMAVAVIGGLVMLMGLFLLNHTAGTLEIDLLLDACAAVENKAPLYWSAALMLFGFGGKAGMYPLHVWLPKAHPVAPAPASALLSGVLTKTGIYGILIICANIFFGDKLWGSVLLGIGVITMFLGAFLALFSVDLKRTLACSSMSQIGFILVASSMQCILLAKESTVHYHFMAAHGALLHMMNHSLIKLVLFMAAGVVYMNLHKLNLNDIRGFGYRKPLLKFIFGMGVLAIIGMPFWSGYISKTLIHESIVEQIWYITEYTLEARIFQVVESIFTLTGGLTTAYMVKIYVAVFFEKNPYHQEEMDKSNRKYMNWASATVLTLCSLILPVLGMTPTKTMNAIASFGQGFMHGHDPDHAVEYFAWQNLRGGIASLTIGAIVYIFIVRGCLMERDANNKLVYVNLWPAKVDLEDRVYRPVLLSILPFLGALFGRAVGSVTEAVGQVGYRLFRLFESGYRKIGFENWNTARIVRVLNDYYHRIGFDTWDKVETRRRVIPLERVPVLDDCLDRLREEGSKPSTVNRLLKGSIGGFDNDSQQEYGDHPPQGKSMLRQTISYSLLIFAVGLLFAIFYTIITSM